MEMSSGWEDWEFFMSLLETGGKAYKLDQVLFYYRILNQSRDRRIDVNHRELLRRKMVQLHPNSYYREYDKLLSEYEVIVNSHVYKLLSFLRRMIKFVFKRGCRCEDPDKSAEVYR